MNTFGTNGIWIAMAPETGRTNAPLLRRKFTIDQPITAATLRISGFGYFEAWINGGHVGDHVLDPAQTDYDQRVFFVTHDVTALIRNGANAIGVMLGNGWYNQNQVWGENGLPYGAPCLLAELEIELANGTHQLISTDTDWRCAPGPITENNIYAGEIYDARLEQPGWNTPKLNDSAWEPAVPATAPAGRLEPQDMPPIRKIEELTPVTSTEIDSGHWIADMGQNFSGWIRMKVSAPAGTEIQLRFAETLAADGSLDTASTGVFATFVEQIDRYICHGNGTEIWEPRFTYHGFRYVEINGWPGTPTSENITGVVVHTDLKPAGSFDCSDERLNQLHRMALWTHRSNIHGIPEDCPVRERCGWLGDANLVTEFSLWNFHGQKFWEKYLDDIETTRTINGGLPCNIAPGKRTCRTANPDWAATVIMLPWYLYVYSGDATALRKHWDGMEYLFTHFCNEAENWILPGGFGDWFDPGGSSCCTHTPPTLTTSMWFFRCAEVMVQTAAALDNVKAVGKYEGIPAKIKTAIIQRYFDKKSGSFGSQTADVLALQFNLTPDGEQQRVLESLVTDIQRRDTHLNTGIMGVRFLFEVLTRHGHGELALALMHQNTYPSFGDLIHRGATTLWECWGEAEHEILEGPRSLNHPMMGGFDNWFYNTLAGIRPDPAQPGFKHVFLEPHPIPGLEQVNAEHHAPTGLISSAWTFQNGRFDWQVVVPAGTTATARLPFSGEVISLSRGTHEYRDEMLKFTKNHLTY